MNELAKSAFLNRPDLHVSTEGEFAGWRTWTRDAFETNNGPFWHRMEDDGSIRCAFRVEKKHLNGARNVHGGCFMSFADYCLFATAATVLHQADMQFVGQTHVLGEGSVLRDCVIGADVRIGADVELAPGVILESGAVVPDHARLTTLPR